MSLPLRSILCAAVLALVGVLPLQAQNSDDDSAQTSGRVEESDEAYRRRMELEDARQRDLGYTLPPETYAQQQEKIDKLPQESRDNIRDQMVDLIVENGDWEPGDALREYAYEPTAAAHRDAELMRQEQEAWDEQIEKYHKREAAAYGTYLGTTQEAGEGAEAEGDGADAQAAGTAGQGRGEQAGAASADSEAASAGTYEPYRSDPSRSEQEVSTAGAEQSALEFLRGQPNQAVLQTAASAESPSMPQGSPGAPQPDQQDAASVAQEATSDAAEADTEIDLSTPGVIPIADLENLQGTETPDEQAQPADGPAE